MNLIKKLKFIITDLRQFYFNYFIMTKKFKILF